MRSNVSTSTSTGLCTAFMSLRTPAATRRTSIYPVEDSRQMGPMDLLGRRLVPLITQLDADLRAVDPTYVVRQVKEKYGALCFTADPSLDSDVVYQRFSVLIAAAEQPSATVCERCGAPAQLCMTNRGTWPWRKTVCSACSDQIAKKAAADTYPLRRVVSNDLELDL